MNAAFCRMKGVPGQYRTVTGVHKRLCGPVGTAANEHAPVQDVNKLSGTL
jgi:hypothetical protein